MIDFIVGEYLYNRYPEMREGALTNLRAALVREETLAIFGQDLNIGRFFSSVVARRTAVDETDLQSYAPLLRLWLAPCFWTKTWTRSRSSCFP